MFLPRDALQRRYAMVSRLYVRLSVTLMYIIIVLNFLKVTIRKKYHSS